MGEDGGGGGVQRVMLAGHRAGPLSEPDTVLQNTHAPCGDVGEDLEIGGGAESERPDAAAEAGRDLPAVSAFVGDEQLPTLLGGWKQLGKISKRLDNVLQRAVHVQVILLDVIDQSHDRTVVVEGAIELARLGHEEPR